MDRGRKRSTGPLLISSLGTRSYCVCSGGSSNLNTVTTLLMILALAATRAQSETQELMFVQLQKGFALCLVLPFPHCCPLTCCVHSAMVRCLCTAHQAVVCPLPTFPRTSDGFLLATAQCVQRLKPLKGLLPTLSTELCFLLEAAPCPIAHQDSAAPLQHSSCTACCFGWMKSCTLVLGWEVRAVEW